MEALRYIFRFAGGRREQFDFRFDRHFKLIPALPPELPEWTRLKSHQCQNCPLSTAEHANCPLAVALADPLMRLGDVISYEPVRVEVVCRERTMFQETTAQDGISALLGMLNATSGCPVTGYFRPMARFHLPFSNEAETLYRAAGMHLLGEYFRARSGDSGELGLSGLLKIYRDMEKVNRGIVARIRASRTEDGALNAIVRTRHDAEEPPVAAG
jgi:hypothetical protein